MNASSVARAVTRDLDLWPPLSASDVTAVAEGDSFWQANRYDENRWAAIESRILQEADR